MHGEETGLLQELVQGSIFLCAKHGGVPVVSLPK